MPKCPCNEVKKKPGRPRKAETEKMRKQREKLNEYTEQLKTEGKIKDLEYSCCNCDAKIVFPNLMVISFCLSGGRMMDPGIKCEKCK